MMSDSYEIPATEEMPAGSVHGLICAFALLIDVLESNGALKPKQFEKVLGSVLHQPGVNAGDADVAVLRQIMTLLEAPDRPSLTVIAGGKS